MARAIWSGHLTFGLVPLPVGLHAAPEPSERVRFHQLHRKDMAPIRYRKFFYLRTRPLLGALIPSGGILSLEVMRNAEELRDPRKLAVKELAAKPAEVPMAATLVEQMTARRDPAAHPNVYRRAVEKLIASKPKFDVADATGGRPAAKVVDLMAALKESLHGQSGGETARAPRAKAKSHSSRGRRAP